jgi:hypothetical protein
MISRCFSCMSCCQPNTPLEEHYKEMNTYTEAFVLPERSN